MTNATKSAPLARPVVLCILDGWGERAERDSNAIALGRTPNWDRMVGEWPRTTLKTSGRDVGLPDGQMGNSEVGHMNIGAGRIVWQDLPRISKAIADKSLAASPEIAKFVAALKQSGGCCNLLGLASRGGVHSHQDHILALAEIVSNAGIAVKVHAFTDGRDTPPRSAIDTLQPFLAALDKMPNTAMATLCGRYYAMDRDNRWERIELCYDALVSGRAAPGRGPGNGIDQSGGQLDTLAALAASYENGISDEFLLPVVLGDYGGMNDGDGLLVANFRADRARQLLGALVDPNFDAFGRRRSVGFAARLGMVSYSGLLSQFLDGIFPTVYLSNTLGELTANAGKRQLRLAETEKYAHVTFFFNGRREAPFAGEERILVPSPKVATYDLQPEMSAAEVTDKLVKAIGSSAFDLIIVNYANGDMVGHTGILDAAMRATETVDSCLARVETAVLGAGGAMLVTADHGNCEMMIDPVTGGPHTAHTLNPVPLLLVAHDNRQAKLRPGRLADLAPTLLDLMGLDQPEDMTGSSLIDAGLSK